MYMPVKNMFNGIFDSEFKSYKLDGVILNDDGVIKRLDKNLLANNKSDIIAVEYKKDGELNANSQKHVLSNEEFKNLIDYAFDCLNGAVDEMLDGYIMPKPCKKTYSPCDKCKYISMCHYSTKEKGYREVLTKSKNDFKLSK